MSNVELATAYVALVPSMQGAQGKIAEALLPAAAEGDKAGKETGGSFAAGFGGVLGAAAIGVAAAGAAVGGAAVGLYKVGAVFDDVTDTIRVGTGASGEALDGLVGIAQKVGTSVPTSFETAGQTVSDLNTRLGLSGDTLSTVAQQYIQAGNILGQDVDITTTTAAFSAFGIEGAAVEGAMDSLFRVSQATGIGMNDLASQVQTSAVPLQNLGFGFDETAALAGTLSKAGLNTGAVMASMGKSLVTLAKDGEEPQAAFKRVTGELGELVKTGDTAGALNLAGKVFGTKGATQFVGALQSGKINLDDLTASAGLTTDTILGLGAETADAAESWQLIKNKALMALEPMGTAVFNLAGTGLGFLASKMDGITAKVSAFGAGVAGIIGILATGDFEGPIFGMEEDSGFVDFLFDVREGVSGVFNILGKGDFTGPFMGLEEDSAFVDFLFDIREGFQAIGPLARQIFDSLKPSIDQLLPSLMQILPQLSPLGIIFKILQPLIPQIADALMQVFGAIAPLIPMVIGVGQQLLAALIPAFVGLVTAIAPLIPIVLNVVTALLPPLMSLFTTLVPIILGVVMAILPLVTTIAGMLIPIIGALLPVVEVVFTTVAALIGSVMQIVQGIIQVVMGLISGNWSMVWEGIKNVFSGIWNGIVTIVTTVIGVVGSVIGAGLNAVSSFIGGVLGGIGRFFSDTWRNITNGISAFVGGIGGFFAGIPGTIMGALSGAGSWLFDAGKNIVQGLFNGIKSLAGTIGNFFLGLLPGWIVEPFKLALGIHSPSTVFRELGRNIPQGLLLGVGDEQAAIDASMRRMVTVPDVGSIGSGRSGAQLAAAGHGSSSGETTHFHGPFYGSPEQIADELNAKKRRASTRANLKLITAGG